MQHPLTCGDVFWLDDVPALDGTRPERRPVVVLSDDDLPLADPGEEIVVATTTQEVTDADAVYLRDELPEPCWAVPRWVLVVRREKLADPAGRITGPKLLELLDAVFGRTYDWPDEPEDKPDHKT